MANSDTQHQIRLQDEAEPQSGERNMAIDKEMLESTIRSGLGTFRIYRWREPTVSLGYFQRKISEDLPSRFRDLPQVQRISGGGAILHHHEITYSISIRRDHPLVETPLSLYDTVHQWIIAAFASQNVKVHSRGKSMQKTEEPFLCFLRSDPRDLILKDHKIVGSAQRRRKGSILQHGSIILRTSECAPEIPGVAALSRQSFSESKFRADFRRIAGESLGFATECQQIALTKEMLP